MLERRNPTRSSVMYGDRTGQRDLGEEQLRCPSATKPGKNKPKYRHNVSRRYPRLTLSSLITVLITWDTERQLPPSSLPHRKGEARVPERKGKWEGAVGTTWGGDRVERKAVGRAKGQRRRLGVNEAVNALFLSRK